MYTLGVRASTDNVLADPADVGAELVRTDRGGDVTYHGPGQLVGYPVLEPAAQTRCRSGLADTVAYVHAVEQVLIDALADLGLPGAGRLRGYPGVWLDPDGDRPAQDRRHRGAAEPGADHARLRPQRHDGPVDVRPHHPVRHRGQGGDVAGGRGRRRSTMRDGGRRRCRRGPPTAWGGGVTERQDVAWRHRPSDLSAFSRGRGRRGPVVRDVSQHLQRAAGARPASSVGWQISTRKPDWLRPKVHHGTEVLGAEAGRARPRSRHGVRGGRLSQPVRVLGRRHGHVHGAGRALHAGLRLLPRRHPQARRRRRDGTRAGGRGRRAPGARTTPC